MTKHSPVAPVDPDRFDGLLKPVTEPEPEPTPVPVPPVSKFTELGYAPAWPVLSPVFAQDETATKPVLYTEPTSEPAKWFVLGAVAAIGAAFGIMYLHRK